MEEIITHIFVGGPKDGECETRLHADRVGITHVRAPVPDQPARDDGNLLYQDVSYERTAYQGEKVRFIFWKAQGLSIDDAMRKLFDHYTVR